MRTVNSLPLLRMTQGKDCERVSMGERAEGKEEDPPLCTGSSYHTHGNSAIEMGWH